MKLCGIAMSYKPYQVVKTDTDANTGNRVPNMLFQILTGVEEKQNQITISSPTDTNKQSMIDYPYSRLISADDDFRMYRPFRFKKVETGYAEEKTDAIMRNYIPSTCSLIIICWY